MAKVFRITIRREQTARFDIKADGETDAVLEAFRKAKAERPLMWRELPMSVGAVLSRDAEPGDHCDVDYDRE